MNELMNDDRSPEIQPHEVEALSCGGVGGVGV